MILLKKLIVAVLSVTAALCLVVGGTYSWFYAQDNVPDKFSMSHFDVRLNEIFTGGYEPGDQKEVVASNVGNMPALVRVSAVPVITGETGTLPLYIDGKAVFKLVRPSPDFDDNWMAGQDGWYYYQHVLLPGEETSENSLYGDGRFLLRVEYNDDFDLAAHPEYSGAVLTVDVMLGSSPVTPPEWFMSIWDVSRDRNVVNMLNTLCVPYNT